MLRVITLPRRYARYADGYCYFALPHKADYAECVAAATPPAATVFISRRCRCHDTPPLRLFATLLLPPYALPLSMPPLIVCLRRVMRMLMLLLERACRYARASLRLIYAVLQV